MKTSIAIHLNNLANLYANTERYEQAEQFYEETLTIYRSLYKENPTKYKDELTTVLDNLARLYKRLNRNEEFETLKQEIQSLQ